MSQMNATYLRSLKRTELQRLAMEHKVKANLKSGVIIDVLLQRFAEVEGTQVEDHTPTMRPAVAEPKTLPDDPLSPLDMPPTLVAPFNDWSQTLLEDITSIPPALAEAVGSEAQVYPGGNQATATAVSESMKQMYPGVSRNPSYAQLVPPAVAMGPDTGYRSGSPSPPDELRTNGDAPTGSKLFSPKTRSALLKIRKPAKCSLPSVGTRANSYDHREERVDVPYPESPPDFSKREDLPAEEELVRETIQMMAEIEKDNNMMMERITKLSTAATEIRSRANTIQALVRAEDMNRTRMMTYLTYWQSIFERWEYREVWSGEMKIRDNDDFIGVTSSDEEAMEDDNDDEIRPAANGQNDTEVGANGEKHTISSRVQSPSPPSDAGLVNTTTTGSSNVRKRPREPDTASTSLSLDNFGPKYTPRRRAEENHANTILETPERESKRIKAELLQALDNLSPPPTPTPKRTVDKGKAKMTAEQVQVLENERAEERFLAQFAKSSPCGLRTVPQHHGNGESSAQAQRIANDFGNGQMVMRDTAMLGHLLKQNGGSLLKQKTTTQQNNSALPNDARDIPTDPAALSSASHQPRPTRRSTRKRRRVD